MVAMHDKYIVSYSTWTINECLLHSVSSQVYLHNFQPSYSKIHSPATYPKRLSLPSCFTHITSAGLQNKIVTYCRHYSL